MNRRRFLELLGMAAAGSAVVYSFPSIIVPKNIALPRGGVWADFRIPPAGEPIMGMRGLPYIVNNTGNYFGLSRHTWREEGDMLVPAPPTESEIMEFPKGWQPLIPEDYHRARAV